MQHKKTRKKKSIQTLLPLDQSQRYDISEACAYLRVSRAYIYKLIKTGELATIADGRRTFVPGTAIADRSKIA